MIAENKSLSIFSRRAFFFVVTMTFTACSVFVYQYGDYQLRHFGLDIIHSDEIHSSRPDSKPGRENTGKDENNGLIPGKCDLNNSLLLTTDDPLNSNKTEKYQGAEKEEENFKAKFKHVWKHYNPSVGMDLLKDPRKYMIYRCGPGMSLCGGWADRMKGMILGYMMANLTGRVFKIDITLPVCDITKYLLPNRVDWRLPKPFHESVNSKKPAPDTAVLDYIYDAPKLTNVNMTDLFNASVHYVYVKGNLDYTEQWKKTTVYQHELSWLRNLRKDKIFAELYKRMFRLSPVFQTRLDKFLDKHLPTPKHKLICAHIRMGRNKNIPTKAEPIRFEEEKLPGVWNFISNHSTSDHHKVFIMSDSDDTVAKARNQSFGHRMVSSPGRVLHVERDENATNEERCAGQEKVIFDQTILMNCDVLLISFSGLGRMAAFVRGGDQGLYCLFMSGDIKKCRSDEFSKLYHITG